MTLILVQSLRKNGKGAIGNRTLETISEVFRKLMGTKLDQDSNFDMYGRDALLDPVRREKMHLKAKRKVDTRKMVASLPFYSNSRHWFSAFNLINLSYPIDQTKIEKIMNCA